MIIGVMDGGRDVKYGAGAPVSFHGYPANINHGNQVVDIILQELAGQSFEVRFFSLNVMDKSDVVYEQIKEALSWLRGCDILNVSMGWERDDDDIRRGLADIGKVVVAFAPERPYPVGYGFCHVVRHSEKRSTQFGDCFGRSMAAAVETAKWAKNRAHNLPSNLGANKTHRQINL